MKKIRLRCDINGKSVIYKDPLAKNSLVFYNNNGFRKKLKTPQNSQYNVLKQNYKYPFGKYSPVYRFKSGYCELCGAHNVSITMYQVRKLTQIKPDTSWNITMLKNNMKTLVTCEICYSLIQMQS